MNRLAEQARVDAGLSLRHRRRWPGGRSCLISHRADAADEGGLPGDYRKIQAIVREADGAVQVRAVGERLGLDASVHGKLEPFAGEDDQARRSGLAAQAVRRVVHGTSVGARGGPVTDGPPTAMGIALLREH
ncbi:hypothetical protein ACIRVK_41330 [Streptomyces sp. NPDC101152]|uniref:hypothetical protein n=1 Tax=Streptomyces sp. NPDC101152 TaxID=3366116 RepID=UPI0038089154